MTFLHSYRRRLRRFRHCPPGRRFRDWYETHQRTAGRRLAHRIAHLGLGAMIALAGLVMLMTPGPGLLALFLGAALLAGESALLAGLLDRLELMVRGRLRALLAGWRRIGWPSRVAMGALALSAVGVGTYGVMQALFV